MSKTPKPETVGFGVPKAADGVVLPHHFRVEIPLSANGPVSIVEDFGLSGGEDGVPFEETRVVLQRQIWSAVNAAAKRDFNARLKERKLTAGQWKPGEGTSAVKVERLLGKELCVLAWAAEDVDDKGKLSVICAKWAALRPEERWWLFAMTCAEAGRSEDKARGWRVALRAALSDIGSPDAKRKPARRPDREERSMLLPLFDD